MTQTPFNNPVPTMERQVAGIYQVKWRRKGGLVYIKAEPHWRVTIAEAAVASAIRGESLPPDDGRWRNCKHNFKVETS